MNEFDIKASEWDNNPMHWERSEAIAKAMIKFIPIKKKMVALEYGAGTGILSFLLKDYFREITMMDNASEMVKVMNNKIRTSRVKNLKTLNFNLEEAELKDAKFDCIFNQMVLHHITDIEDIVTKFHKLLNPGGFLAIADLYPEDGSFHGADFTGYKGFDIDILSNQIRNQDFTNISHRKCFVINKKISETETKKFDVFLLIAKRNIEGPGIIR